MGQYTRTFSLRTDRDAELIQLCEHTPNVSGLIRMALRLWLDRQKSQQAMMEKLDAILHKLEHMRFEGPGVQEAPETIAALDDLIGQFQR